METKTVGELELPVLGLGTWGFGGKMERSTANDKEDVAAIQRAVEAGLMHIDTAELYGDGHAEELVGRAIAGFAREKLFITTKVRWDHARREQVLAAAKASLERLGTDYVDLYLLHGPGQNAPMGETIEALNEVAASGMARHIGVSNFSAQQLAEAIAASERPIAANQVEYSLLAREHGILTTRMESEIVPACQKAGVIVVAYMPVARGRLARPGFPVLDRLAAKHGRTQAQVAINWVLRKPGVVAITKVGDPRHLQEDLGALGWGLEPADVQELDRAFAGAEAYGEAADRGLVPRKEMFGTGA